MFNKDSNDSIKSLKYFLLANGPYILPLTTSTPTCVYRKIYILLYVLPGTNMVTLSCMQQALRNQGSDPEKILLLGRRIAGRIFYCLENYRIAPAIQQLILPVPARADTAAVQVLV